MSAKADENGGRPGEPRERDSMLDDPDPPKRRPGRLHWAADELGLSVAWMLVLAVLGVLALVLLVVVIVLAASWPPPPEEDTSVRCETADCLRAAAQLQSSVVGSDDTACDSFWEHTCSAWLERNPIPAIQSEWGVTEQMLFSAEQRLQRILSTLPHAASPRSYLWKLNAFYLGCMDRATHPDRSDLTTKLRDIIIDLGGFDALSSFERQLWNPAAVIRKLQADHDTDVFFRISVVADPDNSSSNIVQISPGGVGLPERSYYFRDVDDQLRAIYSEFGQSDVRQLCLDTRHRQSLLSLRNKILRYTVVTAYQRYIQDVLLRVGAPTDEASRFAQNMFHYEKRLVEASLEPPQLREQVKPARRVTVDWLRKESPQIEWLTTLRGVYPGGKIGIDTEILLPDDQYIVELSKIVSSTDISSMNAYLMWRLIAGYYPYLPEEDRAVLDVLRRELTGVAQRPPHWLTCTRMTREFFPLATGALLVRDEHAETRQRSQQAATALFEALKQSLGGALTYSRFVSDRSRAEVLQQVSSVQLFCGYPAVLLEDKLLDKVYSEMNVMRHSFFDSVTSARHHHRMIQQKAYLAPGQDQELEPLLNGASVSYSRARHAVILPDQLMRPPLFDPAYPPPFQHGGMGTRLAAAILSSVEPSSLEPGAGDANTTASEETMVRNRETFRDCVSAALTASQLQKQTVDRVVKSATDQVLAVRLALQTLKAHLEEVGEEQLPGLESMPAEKVFFVAYGQSLCMHKTEEKAHWDEFSKFELDGKIKLDLTVEQAAPFREVFHCNASHAHVLKGPCGFFV